jgi:branched-chain amino acid aminotransferase
MKEVAAMWYYMDGKFVPAEEAMIPALDFSCLYGDGCFDSLSVADGVALDLEWRIERLFDSARLMRIAVPVSKERLAELLLETATRNGMHDTPSGYLRPLLSRGKPPSGHIGAHRASRQGVLRILADIFPNDGYHGPIPAVKTVFSSYTRTTLATIDPRIKALTYTTAILADIECVDRGADWPIFRDSSGHITEISGGNLFCVKDGVVLTPPITGILGGVVRRRMINVARDLGHECVETELTRYDLETADEAFITAAIMCVHAIKNHEGIDLPGSVPGPITTKLRDAYVKSAVKDGTPLTALASASTKS